MPASYCFGFSSKINWRRKSTQGLGSRQMSWPLNSWDGTHVIGQFCGSSHLSLWTCTCKKQFGGWRYAALLGHPSLLCCQHSMGGTSFQKESMGKWRESTVTARWHWEPNSLLCTKCSGNQNLCLKISDCCAAYIRIKNCIQERENVWRMITRRRSTTILSSERSCGGQQKQSFQW